jgi:hypothetical protein
MVSTVVGRKLSSICFYEIYFFELILDSQILHTQVENQTLSQNSDVPIYGHKKSFFILENKQYQKGKYHFIENYIIKNHKVVKKISG